MNFTPANETARGEASKDMNQGRGLPVWLHDRLVFEWPWVRTIFYLTAIVTLITIPWESRLSWVAASGASSILLLLALGVQPQRWSSPYVATYVIFGALIPLFLPLHWLQIAWALLTSAIGLLAVGLRLTTPYHALLVRKGDKIIIQGVSYDMPEIEIRSPRIFHVKPHVLNELVDLARFADAFLGKHGIQYVVCYGTLLGALRHGGPMPWDDDVDFTIFRPQDLQKMNDCFDEMVEEVEQSDYRLFQHNDYWKISKAGFWRFPVVDLYRAAIDQPVGASLHRAPWGPLKLCLPTEAEKILTDYYGADCLKVAVFSIPFWDSGFVPAALAKLAGQRISNLAGDIYDRLFK